MKFIITDEESSNYEIVDLRDMNPEELNRKTLEEHVEVFCENGAISIERVTIYKVSESYKASQTVSIKKISEEK